MQNQKTLEQISSLPVHYEEGHDDPSADIRYREERETIARELLINVQLEYIVNQLKLEDKPVKFFVSKIWSGACLSLEIALILEQNGKKIQKELYFSEDQIEPEKAELYWLDGTGLRLTLEDWYNRWLNDPWR